ncbi:MAG: uracil-DNA glycosylase [Desulfobacterales bacterium]|nr:uracil-DNA glycosylase [Desulfobacterales bacterium]
MQNWRYRRIINKENIPSDPLKSWKEAVPLLKGPEVKALLREVKKRREKESVHPCQENLFRALLLTPIEEVRVVILGQDPYHGRGQADGLAFSVPTGVKIPPSLRNIFKEVARVTGSPVEEFSTDLSRWATQGVLLLNTVLSVTEGAPASHAKLGWQQLTDAIIEAVNTHTDGVAFMLWGGYARAKASLINREKHLVLEAPHPSPLSAHRGFLGCGHFTEANQFLQSKGKKTVIW